MAHHRLTIIATSSVPPGIRGALNKWFIEVLPGTFVGNPNTRVRNHLWDTLTDALLPDDDAYAALIHNAQNEQGFSIQTIGKNRYQVHDFDGLQLVVRHHKTNPAE